MSQISKSSSRVEVMPLSGQQSLGDVDVLQLVDHLRETGAVLLRGTEIGLEEFEAFSTSLCEGFHQVGTRKPVESEKGDRFSTEVPKMNFTLFAHSEGTYRPIPAPPDLCFFNCVNASFGAGGETTLYDGVEFLNRLPSELSERLREQGVIYQALWDEARWKVEFRVEDREQLQELLNRESRIEAQDFGDAMEFRCHVDAVRTTLGGQKAFANGILAHLPAVSHARWQDKGVYSKPTNRVFFGDGEEMSESIIHQFIDVQDELMMAHTWKEGDLLVLDNMRVMHGRLRAESDGERVIRSRFGKIRQGLC